MICTAECEIPLGDRDFLGIAKSVVVLHNSTGGHSREKGLRSFLPVLRNATRSFLLQDGMGNAYLIIYQNTV
jgi:hypothetical protein